MHYFTSFLLWTQSRTEQELFQLIFQLLDFLRIEAVVSIASSAFVSHRAPHIVFKRFCFPFFLEMGESYTAWVEIILRSCSCKVLDPGGYCHIWGYIGMCRCDGYGFQAVYASIGYINQSVWV